MAKAEIKKTVKPKVTKTKVVVKESVAKKNIKEIKQPVVKLETVKTVKSISLTLPVIDKSGKKEANITLTKEIFGNKINSQLLSQYVRVYLANQRSGTAHVKTRGFVTGSTRKIFKQKGTGNARHGNIRAPIFVGGGVVFGPISRDHSLKFSKKMNTNALISALSLKASEGVLNVASGINELGNKTKPVAEFIKTNIGEKSVLIVAGKNETDLTRAAKNIKNVTLFYPDYLNTYVVLNNEKILFTKSGLKELEERLNKSI